jgi:hypothetical protein
MTSGLGQKATFVSYEICDIVSTILEAERGGFHGVGD